MKSLKSVLDLYWLLIGASVGCVLAQWVDLRTLYVVFILSAVAVKYASVRREQMKQQFGIGEDDPRYQEYQEH